MSVSLLLVLACDWSKERSAGEILVHRCLCTESYQTVTLSSSSAEIGWKEAHKTDHVRSQHSRRITCGVSTCAVRHLPRVPRSVRASGVSAAERSDSSCEAQCPRRDKWIGFGGRKKAGMLDRRSSCCLGCWRTAAPRRVKIAARATAAATPTPRPRPSPCHNRYRRCRVPQRIGRLL